MAIFEIGRVYLGRGDDLPDERRVLTLASGQYRSAPGWNERSEVTFFDVKSACEAVLTRMGVTAPGYRVSFVAAQHPSFHPGRLAYISVERSAGKKGKTALYRPAADCRAAGRGAPRCARQLRH